MYMTFRHWFLIFVIWIQQCNWWRRRARPYLCRWIALLLYRCTDKGAARVLWVWVQFTCYVYSKCFFLLGFHLGFCYTLLLAALLGLVRRAIIIISPCLLPSSYTSLLISFQSYHKLYASYIFLVLWTLFLLKTKIFLASFRLFVLLQTSTWIRPCQR